MSTLTNMVGGWVAILAGCMAGATQGLFFHNEEWLGGYGSWRRRMMRLGHISFFGIGLINIAFAMTAATVKLAPEGLASLLLLAGLITMPIVCYCSALRRGLRHLFFFPTLCVIGGVGTVVSRLL